MWRRSSALLRLLGWSVACVLLAPTLRAQGDRELEGAIACVIAAWNQYDVDASRTCYDESAIAVVGGERRPIDWAFERRLREFDAAAHSRFRFELLTTQDTRVEFTLYETNDLLSALGLECVTAQWRYTIRGGRVVEEELLKGDGAFGPALQQAMQWARTQRPEAWASVTDGRGNVHFDGATANGLIALAREWTRARD